MCIFMIQIIDCTLIYFVSGLCLAENKNDEDEASVDEDIGKSRQGSKTDDEVVAR